ncbi:MAG: hypothetical protein J6S14_11185 [Clostridia bacterium]|nr:hypothetical protein [Clostridia bacterium]
MKCPYCNKEMKKGYVQSARPIIWGLYKKKLLFSATQSTDFTVSNGYWNGCFAEAYHCPKCKKIIISTE